MCPQNSQEELQQTDTVSNLSVHRFVNARFDLALAFHFSLGKVSGSRVNLLSNALVCLNTGSGLENG